MVTMHKFYLLLHQSFLNSDAYGDNRRVFISDHISKFDAEIGKYVVLWAWTLDDAIAKKYQQLHQGIFQVTTKSMSKKEAESYMKNNASLAPFKLDSFYFRSDDGEVAILCTKYEHNWVTEYGDADFDRQLAECCTCSYDVFCSDIVTLLAELSYTYYHDIYWCEDDVVRESAEYNASFSLDANGLPRYQLITNEFGYYIDQFSFLFNEKEV